MHPDQTPGTPLVLQSDSRGRAVLAVGLCAGEREWSHGQTGARRTLHGRLQKQSLCLRMRVSVRVRVRLSKNVLF